MAAAAGRAGFVSPLMAGQSYFRWKRGFGRVLTHYKRSVQGRVE